MEKIKDNFLCRFVSFTPEYDPHVRGSQFFDRIEMRMIDVENWDEKVDIDRCVFEEKLHNSHELEEAYVDLYSDSAGFVLMFFEIDEMEYEFYCMVDEKKIVLIFFRCVSDV